jgi:hypothetical protein
MDPRTGMMYPLIRGVEAADAACGMGASGGPGVVAAGGMGGLGAGGVGSIAGMSAAPGGAGGALAAGGAGAGGSGLAGASAITGAIAAAGRSAFAAGGGGSGLAGAPGQGSRIDPIDTRIPPDESGCSCSAPGARSKVPGPAVLCAGLCLTWLARRRRKRPE